MKAEIARFIQEAIPDFHRKRLESLGSLKLKNVLKRKNPYLYRAKNINTASELMSGVVDAHLSSQEETVFGAFLENVASYACSIAYQGVKSGIEGVDVEFTLEGIRYIVSIKSGPNWGNSSQIKKMRDNFRKASIVLRQNGAVKNVQAINGCCYGTGNTDKGDYKKMCGESFWTFISGDSNLFVDIIEPLGNKAKERNEVFFVEYSKVINRFTKEFLDSFCKIDGLIDWEKLVRFNSAARTKHPNKTKKLKE